MELKRKYVAVAAAIAALGAGTGVALARAGSDDDAARPLGPTRDRHPIRPGERPTPPDITSCRRRGGMTR